MKELTDKNFEEQSLRFIQDIENQREKLSSSKAFSEVEDAIIYEEIKDAWEAADSLSESDIDELFANSGLSEHSNNDDESSCENWLTYLKQGQKYIYSFGALLVVIVVSLSGYYGSSKEYVVSKGQSLVVSFSDGSELTVAGNSEFSIQEGWGMRSVQMKRGNIFFSVSPNRYKPFDVYTSNTAIQVVGTSFNVSSAGDTDVIIVEHGKVKVDQYDSTSAPRYLTANEKLVLAKNEVRLYDQINVKKETSWRNGYIQFEDESLKDVIDRMNDFYTSTLKVGNRSLEGERVSGSFSTNNIEDFLSALQLLLDVKIDRRNKGEIIIH